MPEQKRGNATNASFPPIITLVCPAIGECIGEKSPFNVICAISLELLLRKLKVIRNTGIVLTQTPWSMPINSRGIPGADCNISLQHGPLGPTSCQILSTFLFMIQYSNIARGNLLNINFDYFISTDFIFMWIHTLSADYFRFCHLWCLITFVARKKLIGSKTSHVCMILYCTATNFVGMFGALVPIMGFTSFCSLYIARRVPELQGCNPWNLYSVMASYTGGAAEKARVAKLQKQREKGRAEVRHI